MAWRILLLMLAGWIEREQAAVIDCLNEAFMLQCARQLTDPFEGFLTGKRHPIQDRDTKFTAQLDRVLREAGVKPIRLPPQSLNLNAHAERFVRSIKEETLNHPILFNERGLRYTLRIAWADCGFIVVS